MINKILAKKELLIKSAQPHLDKVKQHYKDNPTEIKKDLFLAGLTCLLLDIESEVDDLEEISSVSAFADIQSLTR